MKIIKFHFEFTKYKNSKLATFLSMFKSGFSGFVAWTGLFLIPFAVSCAIASEVGLAIVPAIIIPIITVVSYACLFFIDESAIAERKMEKQYKSTPNHYKAAEIHYPQQLKYCIDTAENFEKKINIVFNHMDIPFFSIFSDRYSYKPIIAAIIYINSLSLCTSQYRKTYANECFSFVNKSFSDSQKQTFNKVVNLLGRIIRGEIIVRGDWCMLEKVPIEKESKIFVFFGDLLFDSELINNYKSAPLKRPPPQFTCRYLEFINQVNTIIFPEGKTNFKKEIERISKTNIYSNSRSIKTSTSYSSSCAPNAKRSNVPSSTLSQEEKKEDLSSKGSYMQNAIHSNTKSSMRSFMEKRNGLAPRSSDYYSSAKNPVSLEDLYHDTGMTVHLPFEDENGDPIDYSSADFSSLAPWYYGDRSPKGPTLTDIIIQKYSSTCRTVLSEAVARGFNKHDSAPIIAATLYILADVALQSKLPFDQRKRIAQLITALPLEGFLSQSQLQVFDQVIEIIGKVAGGMIAARGDWLLCDDESTLLLSKIITVFGDLLSFPNLVHNYEKEPITIVEIPEKMENYKSIDELSDFLISFSVEIFALLDNQST